MAAFRKRKDKWHVQIRKSGTTPLTKTFTHKKDAQQWANEIERKIDGCTINKLKASGKYEVPASVTPKKSFTNKTAKPADSGSKNEGGTDIKSRLDLSLIHI